MTPPKAKPTLVNVNTAENPVMVPVDVAENNDQSPTSRSWWNGLASGSIVVPSEVLTKLLGGHKPNE